MTALAVRTQLDQARTALAKVETVAEAVTLRAFAEAVRYAAKQAKGGMDAQNEAAEIRLRAERRAGELLAQTVQHQGGRPGTVAPRDRLSDVGVTKSASSRYQQVAEIPERPFEQYIDAKKKAAEEITTAELLRKTGPPAARNVAAEALKALLSNGPRTPPSGKTKLERQWYIQQECVRYYESYGDPFGFVFHAEKAMRLLPRAASELTLGNERLDLLATSLRDAANALDAVQRSEAPAE